MVFDKFFGWAKKRKPDPDIYFGRYSDNNKTLEKVNRWTEAENLFKQQEYHQSLDAFFDYLRDDNLQNVVLERNEKQGRFHFYQGSKIVRGEFDEKLLQAEVSLARMPQPSVAVMRRLLEMNFNLYYSRYSLDQDRLSMRFDSDIRTANPNKLYYGLKELAIKADKQDDLLVQEFASLQPIDTEHIVPLPDEEKEVKYRYMQTWIKGTLDFIDTLDSEKFSGGIAYLLLALAFRIDFLILPEGRLLNDLEKVVDIYFRKEEKPIIERNQSMIEGFKKIMNKPREDVASHLFRSRHTFAIVSPQTQKSISDAINSATQNMFWYRDNNYPFIANKVIEYGILFCQFSYSLPEPMTHLVRLFMQVNYHQFFAELSFGETVYDESTNQFDKEEIEKQVDTIIAPWKKKYPKLEFNHRHLKYDHLVNFNHSFATELGALNFDS